MARFVDRPLSSTPSLYPPTTRLKSANLRATESVPADVSAPAGSCRLVLNDTSTIIESPVLRNACTTPGGMVRRQVSPAGTSRSRTIARFLETDQTRADHAGDFDGRSMHVIAAHFVGLSEHDVDVLLGRELRIIQWLKDAAARIAMSLYGLHGSPARHSVYSFWRL